MELRDRLADELRFRPENQFKVPTKYKMDAETGQVKTGGQIVQLNSMFGAFLKGTKKQRQRRLALLSLLVGRELSSSEDLTRWEASVIIDKLKVPGDGNYDLSDSGRVFLSRAAGYLEEQRRPPGTTGSGDPFPEPDGLGDQPAETSESSASAETPADCPPWEDCPEVSNMSATDPGDDWV